MFNIAKSNTDICKIFLYSFLGLALFFLVGIISKNVSHFMIPYGYVLHFVLYTFGVYTIISYLSKIYGLSLIECRISSPKFTLCGITVSAALPIIFWTIEICGQSGYWKFNEMPRSQIIEKIFYLFFYTGLCSGLVEEMMFRGYLTKISEQHWGKIKGILLPTFLFIIGHCNLGDRLYITIPQILFYSSMSVLLTLVTYKSNSIWDAALIHSVWDMLVARNDVVSVDSKMDYTAFVTFILEDETTHPLINLSDAELLIISSFILWVIIGILTLWFKWKNKGIE